MDPEKETGEKGITYVFDKHEEMFKKVLSKKQIRSGIWQLIPSTCGKYVRFYYLTTILVLQYRQSLKIILLYHFYNSINKYLLKAIQIPGHNMLYTG